MLYWLRFLALALLGSAFFSPSLSAREAAAGVVALAELPPEARQTFALIKGGGPFPHGKDGAIFGNFEKRLPFRPRGYYREYTVKTPGRRDRGPRRIVAGGPPQRAEVFYYSEDHYRSFRRIEE